MTQSHEKKTALACDQCRRQKRKCDGQTPRCMACERGSIECTYTATLAQRKQPQRNYVAALEARVALLEKILKDAETNGTPGSSPATGTSGASPHQTCETIPDSSPIGTPTMNPIPTLVDDAADILTLGPTIQVDSFADLDLGMEGYETLLSLEHEHKLLAQFWDWQRMHHPYVAPVPFLSSYAIYSELVHPDEPIPSPPPPPPKAFAATALNVPRASNVQRTPDLSQYISPLLLYSMFAIAALFHGDVETGEVFYERARGMVFMEAVNPRVATVQAICLMATWELGYARSPAAWTLIGVAWSLCIRLGLNVDSTLLLQSGAISQRLYETRNFVMWAVFNTDRLRSTCMGMRPLIDRRAISTPRHSSPSADTVESRNATSHFRDAQEVRMTWWSPSTLGMGDVLVQAAWDTLRELIQMMDNLFDSVYATDASTRTPQEILELVAQNHLTIQKFIDKLPTWLRSTGAIRRKESGLVYMHLFIHLTSILTNRPFLSSHHLPSDTTRKYRTLAFRIARASALQVSSLIRHIPLSSPCVTMPYIVYSACTVLLLAPEDPAALDGVRTGLACLNGMDETGYWADSAKDAARRVRALAERWGVELSTSRRVLGLVGGGIGGGKAQGSSPGGSEPSPAASTRPSTSTGSGTTHIPSDPPSTSRSEVSASGFGTGSVELDDVTLPDNINAAIDRALQVVQPSHGDGLATDVQDQPARLTVEQIEDLAYGPTPFHIHQPDYYAPQSQLPPRANTYHPYRRDPPKKHVPHVAYANSHADLQHDMHVPHSHWHSIIQPADPTDPSVCSDIGSCFSYTVEHAMDPAFVDRVGDPYAGVAMDWGGNAESSFPRYAGYGLTSRLAEGFGERFSGYGY